MRRASWSSSYLDRAVLLASNELGSARRLVPAQRPAAGVFEREREGRAPAGACAPCILSACGLGRCVHERRGLSRLAERFCGVGDEASTTSLCEGPGSSVCTAFLHRDGQHHDTVLAA